MDDQRTDRESGGIIPGEHAMKAISASIIVLAGAVLMHTNADKFVIAGGLIGSVGLVSWVSLMAIGGNEK